MQEVTKFQGGMLIRAGDDIIVEKGQYFYINDVGLTVISPKTVEGKLILDMAGVQYIQPAEPEPAPEAPVFTKPRRKPRKYLSMDSGARMDMRNWVVGFGASKDRPFVSFEVAEAAAAYAAQHPLERWCKGLNEGTERECREYTHGVLDQMRSEEQLVALETDYYIRLALIEEAGNKSNPVKVHQMRKMYLLPGKEYTHPGWDGERRSYYRSGKYKIIQGI